MRRFKIALRPRRTLGPELIPQKKSFWVALDRVFDFFIPDRYSIGSILLALHMFGSFFVVGGYAALWHGGRAGLVSDSGWVTWSILAWGLGFAVLPFLLWLPVLPFWILIAMLVMNAVAYAAIERWVGRLLLRRWIQAGQESRIPARFRTHCSECGYDMTGHHARGAARCPECGKPGVVQRRLPDR